MSRIAYVNGRYVPHDYAEIHIDDRGYQFGDGIYEVVSVIKGELIDQDWHLDRMDYSLGALEIPHPMSRAALKVVIKHMMVINRVRNGLIYFQITRGVMRRDHAINRFLKPQLVMTAKHMPKLEHRDVDPVAVITVADQRWRRRDIKTLQLLPNCLAKTEAEDSDSYEAWMVDGEGFITEGSSSNAWIVTKNGELVTRPATYDILSGITRKAILEIASMRNLKIIERPFTKQDVLDSAESFVTSASSLVTPVGSIDGEAVGDGKSGPVSVALRHSYLEKVSLSTSG